MTQAVKAFKCQRTGKTFATEALAQASENRLPKAKVAELKRRIKLGRYWVPKEGDVIYVPTSMSISHGETDVAGGLGLVTRVYKSMSGGDAQCVFVEVAQHPNSGYNWKQRHFKDQAYMMDRYGSEIAHPDPDYGSGRDINGGGWL